MRDTRIQKVLSEQGYCSRRAAEQLIADGRVTLNGRPVSLGDKMDLRADLLAVDGRPVALQRQAQHLYYMLHKPRGYITTMSDERGRRTAVELLTDVPVRVYPVGRLDKDSEGLLLFTNDGELANMLTHPSHGIAKTYRVTVHPRASEDQVLRLGQGVVLDDGVQTLPATVRVLTDEPTRTVLEMTIREGKNRQIRRMCAAVGLEVARLRRTAEGPIRLGMLQPGEYRELTAAEVAALRASAQKALRAAAPPPKPAAPRMAPALRRAGACSPALPVKGAAGPKPPMPRPISPTRPVGPRPPARPAGEGGPRARRDERPAGRGIPARPPRGGKR